MAMNVVVLSGRLAHDPEKGKTHKGKTKVTFQLAVDMGLGKKMRKRNEAQGKYTAFFIPIVTYGALADLVYDRLRKGCRVVVNGSLFVNRYEKEEGGMATYTGVNAGKLDIIDWDNNGKEEDEDYTTFPEDAPF